MNSKSKIGKSTEREYAKKTRTQQGITLVALTITIIVIIILATVTINMAFRDNGLVDSAELAKVWHQMQKNQKVKR